MDVLDTELTGALRQAGYRMTQPRLAVLQVLRESGEQLSPYEIHRRGKEIYARLGLVTVYRTLELLDELGIARRVHSDGHCHGYALAGGDQHYLICRRCGQVAEFPCKGMAALIENVRRRTGFTVEEHLLEFKGLCPGCQAEAEGAEDGA